MHMGLKAVVTGGTGFIGKWLIQELLNHNVDITILTMENEKIPEPYMDKVKAVVCPLTQLGSVDPDCISTEPVDAFFHFAWSGTSGNERADIGMQLKNAEFACDAVQLASKLGAKRFVNAGSIMEYEAMQYIPSDGSKPGLGNMYSIAKLTADFMSKTLATSLQLPYINVVISNIYGRGERSARFFNTILRKMIKNEDIPLTHGNQLYDFIYASDAVKGIVLAGFHGKSNHTYYIGNAEQRPLREFVIQMKEISGSASELQFGAIPLKGAMLTYKEFDTDKLHRELGFEPQITFEQGVKLVKEFMQSED
jgi:UDP-glucose 4-epimerase